MRTALLLLMFFISTQTYAQGPGSEQLIGQELNNMCKESKTIQEFQTGNFLHAGVCIGYILGIIDDEAFRAETDKKVKKLFCVPSEVSRFELVDVVLNYFGENPLAVNFTAASVVAGALQEEYPCTLA